MNKPTAHADLAIPVLAVLQYGSADQSDLDALATVSSRALTLCP